MNQAVLSSPVVPQVVGEDPYASQFRFTVEQYEQLIDQGIVEEGAPYELLDGIIFRKNRADVGENEMTHGPKHAHRIEQLNLILGGIAKQLGLRMRCQLPLQLGLNDAPEPDFALIKPLTAMAVDRHPQGDEVALVIEIASSSLNRDRNQKLTIYAQAGIPEYWIIDLTTKSLEVYQAPDAELGRYQQTRTLKPGEQVDLSGTSGQTISLAVTDLVG